MMKIKYVRVARLIAVFIFVSAGVFPPARGQDDAKLALKYAPAPVDNPLKGLVPYARPDNTRFPHSMEFQYVPLASLVTGEKKYDWALLEALLDEIASRGHQAIFRVYVEYPGRPTGIPAYLLENKLKVYKYLNTNTQPFPPAEIITPDYSDANLRKCLQDFIAALGKKYDGDRRIGFITAGLLGTWGEWHTWPRNDLWASHQVQAEVLDAYEAAFKTTPVMARYPAGENNPAQTSNAGRKLGYHDDSFAWATLDTGKPGDEWFFMAAMKTAGPGALNKWKQYPVGGEIRPEAWGKVFDEVPDDKQVQDFAQCVQKTHVTWLMDSGIFRDKTWTEARNKRADEQVRRMGYEFYLPGVTMKREGQSLLLDVEIENRGVAPFYYDWPVEYALLSGDGSVAKTFKGQGKLTGLLPGDPARVWKEKLDVTGVAPGQYQIAIRVPNPLPQGKSLRFANETQGQHASGWMTLMPLSWK